MHEISKGAHRPVQLRANHRTGPLTHIEFPPSEHASKVPHDRARHVRYFPRTAPDREHLS